MKEQVLNEVENIVAKGLLPQCFQEWAAEAALKVVCKMEVKSNIWYNIFSHSHFKPEIRSTLSITTPAERSSTSSTTRGQSGTTSLYHVSCKRGMDCHVCLFCLNHEISGIIYQIQIDISLTQCHHYEPTFVNPFLHTAEDFENIPEIKMQTAFEWN